VTFLTHQWLSSLKSFDKSFFLFKRSLFDESLLFCFYRVNLPLILIRLFYFYKIKIRVVCIIYCGLISRVLIIIILKYFDIYFLHFLNRIPLIWRMCWIISPLENSIIIGLLPLVFTPYFWIRIWSYFIIVFYYFDTVASRIVHSYFLF
jgi:hypothetical protein